MPVTRIPHADAAPDQQDCGGDADYKIDAGDDNGSRTQMTAQRPASDREVSEQLGRTIESEVIPRLMLVHSVSPEWGVSPAQSAPELKAGNIEDFTQLILQNDYAMAAAYIEARRFEGAKLDQIFLDLMAPSAKLLGEYWDNDYCDFTQVTIGLSMLQQLLRKYSPAATVDGDANAPSRQALVMPAPGEQHTFGISMVEEFMRSGGWHVQHHPAQSADELVKLVHDNWYALIGLSLSHETLYHQLSECIGDIRRQSRNESIGVMVGGPFFLEHPELIQSVGADATAVNGPDAVVQARSLVQRKRKDN